MAEVVLPQNATNKRKSKYQKTLDSMSKAKKLKAYFPVVPKGEKRTYGDITVKDPVREAPWWRSMALR